MSEKIEVTDNPDRSRFEIHTDGRLAGFAEYRRRENRIVFTHTEVNADQQGKGLAGRLAAAGLDTARSEGAEVVPVCSFIADYIDKHPEYGDLVAASPRE